MNLSRRQKYMGPRKNNKAVKTDQKINLDLDLNALNLFCAYLISNNKNIKRSQVINLRNLFEIIDLSKYNDEERLKRIDFIKKGITARLELNLNDPVMILSHINGGLLDANLIDIQNFAELSNSDLQWINGTVSETLNNSYIFFNIDKLLDAAMAFKTADYTRMSEAAKSVRNVITAAHTEFRRNDARATADAMFSLSPERFETCMRQFHEELSNPSRKLRLGMTGWNEILNGGFENQRVYSIFGLPSEGKSTTLLDIAIQIKKYNKDYQPKDPTKRPCVVLLTMENGERETIERMWAMLVDREEMSHYTVEEVMQILREEGELYLSDENPIDLIIKYVPGESVDTGYLYTLTEDLEDEGYEVIALIQDYLKRIRPVYNANAELRIQYGSVVNEFKVFSILKDIPVITASQLNRDAIKHIDEGRKTNKADLLRLFGRSNIGESQLILENLDGAYFIVPEYDQEGNKYLGIQKVKSRFYSMLEWFYQPYTDYSPIKFVEDVNMQVPAYKLTLREQPQYNTGGYGTTGNQNVVQFNTIKEYNGVSFLQDNEQNTFSSATVYSSQAVARRILNPGFIKAG